MKQKLLFLLVLLLTAATGAWAQQPWKSGDCTVTLSDGVLTVSGTGDMEDYEDYNQLPWNVYEIKTIVIESGVTSIGTYAFSYCSNLESVSIPASVTSIDELAFQGCGSDAAALTVSFAEGSTPLTIGESAFVNANLKSIDIPNRVTGIGRSAFSYCTHLESVSIPASVTSIGGEAFQNCGSEAAALTVSFAEGSTPLTISGNAFYEANLKSIDIPNRVTSIGDNVFTGCSNLESISIPASVTSIGNYAFTGCSNLESVSIPASVTSIGEGAFSYCSKLAKVYIFAPNLTTYGADAFAENAAVRKIYVLPKAVDTYKDGWSAYVNDIEAMPGYTVTLAEGTEDAENWKVKVGEGEAQELPVEGLEGGETVTVTYSGEKKVKSVKAVKKAAAYAANEYNEASWDDTNKKVVFEKKKATTTPVAVADATANVTWGDGYYTVSGNVTITGNVTLTADAHLILQDGATLTINGQLDCRTNKKNLYIYGQKKGDGKLNVTNNSAIANNSSIAINSDWNYRIDIHGGEVTAASTSNIGLNTGYLAVYGGKLTATSGGGNGINFNNTIDVYGGVVEATSNATSNARYGIASAGEDEDQILTVYGGKVTATGNGISGDYGNYGSGFGCYVKSGTSGIKFYFSDSSTTWGDGTSYDSATSVGLSESDAATKKRYAKAE